MIFESGHVSNKNFLKGVSMKVSTFILFILLNTSLYSEIPTVLIKADTFKMGNITGHPTCHQDELPVHDVILTQDYYIGIYEVTQKEWYEVMGINNSMHVGDSLPVENITWLEMTEFCNKLSALEGLAPCFTGSGTKIECDFSKNGYRLPTDAEWEYACRAGTTTDFYTGNQTYLSCSPKDPAFDEAGWYCGNANCTHPVGLKTANAFGIYDMHGNVWEFVWDWYDAYYYTAGCMVDPRGPSSGKHKSMRGGSYGNTPQYGRASDRNTNTNYYFKSNNLGFRIARSVSTECEIKIPSINSAKQEYCYGDYITLNTQGYFSDYKWYENDVLINGANDSIIYIAGTKTPGEYTYYVEAISCDSLVESEEFVITIFPEVSTGLSEDTTICEGDMIELEATDGYNSYLWSNGSTDSFIFVKNAGTYWVEIEDSHGCIGRDSITVNVSPLPDIEIHLSSEPPYYSGDTVVLSAVPFISAYTHEWSTGSSDSVINVTESGKYTLLVTNEFGCQNSYSVDLEFVDTCDETSFVYDDFSDPKNLKLVGQASHQQNYIRLTPSRINSIGAMWYHRPLPVLNGFTTEFSFRMSDGIAGNDDETSLPGADGIVFVIQNSGNNIIGGDGGRIGYSGLNNSLAIEFDLYANDSKQIVNFNDPNGNHVALMKSVDNIISARHTESNTLAINDSILEIKSDKTEYFAKIDYNIVNKTLRVYLSESDYYGQPVINYYPIELDQVLNLNEGEWAYVGFTSATGESYQIHDIMSWYVCPQPTESILWVDDEAANETQLNSYYSIDGNRNLTYCLEAPGDAIIKIYDLLGREVLSDKLNDLPAGQNTYQLPQNLSGIYFYYILYNNKLINGRIIL